jgi:hypothetical protein
MNRRWIAVAAILAAFGIGTAVGSTLAPVGAEAARSGSTEGVWESGLDGHWIESSVPLERPVFAEGQLLSAEDLEAEQAYLREKDRLHNRMLHGWGVVCGLNVQPLARAMEPRVLVTPGYLLGPNGDEIIVPEEQVIDLFSEAGTTEPAGGCAAVVRPGGRRLEDARTCAEPLYLCIRYRECLTRFVPSPGSNEPQATRVLESYEFGLLPQLPEHYLTEGHDDPCIHRLHPSIDPESQWVVLATIIVTPDSQIDHITTDHRRHLPHP